MNISLVPIGDVAVKVTKGTTPTTLGYSFTTAGIPFIRVQNLVNGGVDVLHDTLYIDQQTHQALERSQIQKGDLLISIAGTIGRSAIVVTDGPLNCNQAVAIVRFNSNVDQKFVLHWLSTRDALQQISSKGVTGTITNLSLTQIRSLRIPLPPLAEQKRIAAILDAADALRAKRRESLAQLDTLLQSTFLGMFGDPTSKGWAVATVEEMASQEKGSIRTGPFGSQLLHSEFVDRGIRVLGIDNAVANEFREGEPRFITPEKFEKLRRYTVRPGDVLITIMGTCGRCAVVPDSISTAINTKHLCCITLAPEKCVPAFLQAYFLLHPMARKYLDRSAKGAIMSGLNMGIIKKLPIPLVPLSLQHRIATIVESVEQQKTRLRAHMAELDTLFASLQSRAFNGEL